MLDSGGPYTGVAGVPVQFDASGSNESGGNRLKLAWSTGDGGTAASAKAQHTYAVPGTYAVVLTGTDGAGATASVHTTATITAAELPLVASAGGPYSGTVGNAVAFNAAGARDANGPSSGPSIRYTWNFGDGTLGSGMSASHAYSAAGSYAVTLTVDNGHGKAAQVKTAVTVADAQETPVAVPGGPYESGGSQPIQFDGSASSGGGSSGGGGRLTYLWSFGDGQSATGPRPMHQYAAAGTYTVTLTVDDGHGGVNTATTMATVPDLKAPVANTGGPYAGLAGTAVDFSAAKSSDPNGYSLTYAWTFGDKGTGTGEKPVHTYVLPGTYTVSLTVKDSHGATAKSTTTASIAAVPVANPGGPYTGIAEQVIEFDGTKSTAPKGKKLTYAWNFGDKTTATGAQPTHKYAAAGSFAVTLTVNDGVAAETAKTTATINAVIGVTITTPTAGTLTNKPIVSVSGTVAEKTAKVTVNGEAAVVSAGKWTAKSVSLREGVNLVTATATDSVGNTGTAGVSVTLDTTPPSVSIVAPAAGAKVFAPQVTVSGLVSDLVAGTVNAQNVSVSVNGVPANVVNRSFSAPGVILSPGQNTIEVVATDKAGNTGTASVQVNYKTQITQQTILAVSGEGQTGLINSTLPQPLVAQLVAANGQPVAGRPVTFTVTRSDGKVQVLPSEGNSLSVLSDAKGMASVLFQIGSRAGVGINQVTATTPGFSGQALFTATSTNDKPAVIRPVIGEHQRGIIGQAAPQPFQVIVTDRAGNPLENVPVAFTVTAGGGNIGGKTAVTQETNSDGKATVSVTLGLQEGTDNNLVTANFTGSKSSPVFFHASGLVPGKTAATSVVGVVLDNTNTPVKGATVSLEGTKLRTTTNAEGQFTLKGAPVGTVTLLVDGSTSSSATTYPSLSFVLQSLPGVANSLDKPFYLPAIDTENAQTVGGSEPVTLTMSGVPGVAFTVAPNSVTFPDGSHVGKLSLSQVKADMVPMQPVNGVSVPLVWTLQPAGAKFNPPIQVQLPNVDGLAPGTVTEVYQYDHDLEQFVSGGTARVSPDGSVIVSDPGFGIVKAGWGHGFKPLPPNNCTISCNEHSACLQDSQTADCSCRHMAINIGGRCGGTTSDSCLTDGNCDAYGHCQGSMPVPDGKGCDDKLYCTKNDMCKSGVCSGTPIPDQDQGNLTVGVDLAGLFAPLDGFAETFMPGAMSFQVNQSSSGKKSCCEEKQGSMEDKKNDKYSLRMQVSEDIPVPGAATPPITVPFFGTYEFGLYTAVSGYAQGGLGVYYEKCTDSVCVTGDQGQLSVQIGYSLKIVAGPKGAQLNASVGIANASTASLNTTDCHTLVTKFNLSALKVSWNLTIPGTKTKLPGSTTDLFTGVEIPGSTYTFN
jgi:PKD repeat protein